MPMPPYPVLCSCPCCGQPAVYKIAARWSDGVTQELKTYALSCEACLISFVRFDVVIHPLEPLVSFEEFVCLIGVS